MSSKELQQLRFDFEVNEIVEETSQLKKSRSKRSIDFVDIHGEFFLRFPHVLGKMDDEDEVEQRDHMIQWVIHRCLYRYFEMRLQSKVREIPKLTSNWLDMPSSGGGGFYSSTEVAALKRNMACEWIQTFHTNLAQLPSIHRSIIEKKFLQRNEAGRCPHDQFVYDSLYLSRSEYYRMKKEALYWLALLLQEEVIMQ